jgi:hypothetical protein
MLYSACILKEEEREEALAFQSITFSLSGLAAPVQFGDLFLVFLFLLLVSLHARLVVKLPQFFLF